MLKARPQFCHRPQGVTRLPLSSPLSYDVPRTPLSPPSCRVPRGRCYHTSPGQDGCPVSASPLLGGTVVAVAISPWCCAHILHSGATQCCPTSAALAGLRPGSSQPAHIAEVHRPAVPRARSASGLQVQRLLVLGCMTARAPGTRCDRTEITKAGLRRGGGGAAHGRWSLGRPWGRAEGR